MEDQGSEVSNTCLVCGKTLPAECDMPGCHQATTAAVCACGSSKPCEKEQCLLSHESKTHMCAVCGQEVEEGTSCSRIDCPRVAAAQIRKASIDTPFKLGL